MIVLSQELFQKIKKIAFSKGQTISGFFRIAAEEELKKGDEK